MLEFLKKVLKAKEEKRAALVRKSNESTDVTEVRGINTELETLASEIAEIRQAIEEAEQKQEQTPPAPIEGRSSSKGEPEGLKPIATYGLGVEKRDEEEVIDHEKRGKDLLESRSVTIGSGTILTPHHQAKDIKGTFNQVSSLVDRVTHKQLDGGESYSRAYEKGIGEGGYTAEGEAAHTAEPTFGYAEITKSKITAYAEETEEIEKLPAAKYSQTVEDSIRKAIRRKIAREILVGDGSTNHLMGIFNTNVIEAGTDLEISAITNTTLNEIMFSYGGDEDVEDAAVLLLNKMDLKAFSQLRTDDGKPFHTIKANGNVGTIDGVPYIINSACAAVSAAGTLPSTYCMAYGPLSNYEMAIFSDIDTKKSTEYKFKEGMICHKGVAFIGGNVAAHNGFIRVKKA